MAKTKNQEAAYEIIASRVEQFADQREIYKKKYNETQTRIDFINPFFMALGWDIDNTKLKLPEAYRDVIHEDKIKVGGKTKAPDYCFTNYGKKQFFLEAKKPSVSVKTDVEPSYQLRRYGWSAKLPISILTDFEEFAVYDCSKTPKPEESAATGRLKYITFDNYLKEFDWIWDLFAKEQVMKGSLEQFASSDKKGTQTVDNVFLQSLDEWRSYLATSIAVRNKHLDEDEINYVVQMNLNRIVFLRNCEDRGIEPYGKLKESLINAKDEGGYFKHMVSQFKEADRKYNSGLFDFSKDTYSRTVVVDNKVIKTIVEELYYPKSPYEFSVIGAEILGTAYERFLGKVIRLTTAHHAKVEEKPEVRKAGGVFYTPQYIVEHIVKQTVGNLIEGKTPEEITKIKICDPACGSGSFLLGAFQFLLDYHLNWYTKKYTKSKASKGSPLTPEGNLTTQVKKQILLNNIFGVDIDTQAVEVTKLSLLMKCMEGETKASMQTTLAFERILPTLDNNIKSGNSLIDMDFYEGRLDFGEDRKIKPFNWKSKFPEVFKHGGFDAIIGNPPYVMLQNLETRETFDYALKVYQSAKYKIDTYQLFVERSIKLLKEKGKFGYITPNTFLKNIHSEPLRKILLANTTLVEITIFKYSVFASASVDTCIFTFSKEKPSTTSAVKIFQADKPNSFQLKSEIKQSTFATNNRNDFNVAVGESDNNLLEKIKRNTSILGQYCNAYFGIQTFDRSKYVSANKISKDYKPVIDGGNIDTYQLKPSKEFVKYVPEAIKSGGNELVYSQERICIRQIGAVPIASIVPANLFTLNTIYNVYLKEKGTADLHYLLGIINSKVARYFWRKMNSDEKATFPKIKKEGILSIPIRQIKTKDEKEHQKEMVKQVKLVLQLYSELSLLTLESKKEITKDRIAYSIQKIDELVYKLYDLTEEEIQTIENL
jgi:type I restriction-modification system DNA methylase subunit